MSIYRYNLIKTDGPNGYIIDFQYHPDGGNQFLANVDGVCYVHIKDDLILDQPSDINCQLIELTDETRELIKQHSPLVKQISDQMQQRIRSRYTLEDEQYFARIGVGIALGAYQFQPGEQEALLEFGNYVESVRDWGRQERAKIGL